ncbi:MAG: tyrosine-type recombinase/integrase [Candidatus Bathyarchaeota archaeon]|nr:tyrosine-type recombinase/integrase [Candidatus Termiticorpusculum sp.]
MLTEGKVDFNRKNRSLGRQNIFYEKSPPPKQSHELKCPQCGCERLFRDGIRYLQNKKQVQRWLCRECNYRFSKKPKTKVKAKKQRIIPVLEKHLKTPRNGSSKRQDRDEFYNGRARYLLAEGNINLVKVDPEQINAQREGTQTQQNTTNDVNGKIVSFLWEMKKSDIKDSSLKTWNCILRQLAKHTDMTPDDVKEYLAKRAELSQATKRSYVAAYDKFLKHYGDNWDAPNYVVEDKIQYIPPEADIDALIAGSGRLLSTYLQFLKETAARGGEAAKTKWSDVDFERKIVHIRPEKHSRARILPISNKLVDMLNRLPRNSEKIFSTHESLRSNFHDARKTLIYKLQNPRLKDIHLHTFRHWKATMEYHKTKDILHVQQMLGHKSIECTLVYITIENALYKNTIDDYTVKVAKTIDETISLLEVGFEYVTGEYTDGGKILRKRK